MTARAPRPTPSLPESIRTVHIIGVCGTAMAAMAGMLQQRGYRVRGSDAMAYPPVSDLLEQWNVPIMRGYRRENLDDRPDLVVVGNVCRRDNPEAQRMVEEAIPYLSLPEALRLLFMADRRGIVITGTHGKSTTTSLVSWLIYRAGLDPSYLVGAVPTNFDANFRLGEGRDFVVEGDEYDTAYFDKVPKFWHYPASLAVINNIEFDHADIYSSLDEIQSVFDEMARRVAEDGVLWVNGDCPRSVRASRCARAKVKTFGLGALNDLIGRDARTLEEGTEFSLWSNGHDLGRLVSPLFGEHNLRNALGAIALALDAGVALDSIREALPAFLGLAKRQEVKGIERDVIVIDDFAHHPTAVRATLRAIRERFPERRLWAVFEVKSNTSRRAVFQDEYARAFDDADRVVFSEVWKKDDLPEDQKLSLPRLVDAIRERGKTVALIPSVDDIVEYLAREVSPMDVVVGLSGSDFGGLHDKLVQRLGRDR